MRKAVKQQMLQLLTTLKDAHSEIQLHLKKKDYEKVTPLLADCQTGALTIGNTIEEFQENQEDIIRDLEAYCEVLFRIHTGFGQSEEGNCNKLKEELNQRIQAISRKIEEHITVNLKVVFFPYKASMWTSLETIWRAAQEDAECDAKVVVIPYYTLDSAGNRHEMVYEATQFPDDVPIVPYNEYALEKEQPDLVFIHNPYDDTNNVTQVPEQYYSYNIKPYTGQLVYSPYGMMGYYSPQQGTFMPYMNAVRVADKILVQSEKVKQIYINHGIHREKLIALGSPKVDAIVEGIKKPKNCPEAWREKLVGRKIFLLNTHLSYFINGYIFQQKYDRKRNFSEYAHEIIFEELLNREGCALIWRQHPLLKATLESRELFSTLNFIEECEQRIQESENAVLDENGDYNISFGLSDALITTYSSLVPEYMISGKPIYIYQHRLNENNCRKAPVSYLHNYYRAGRGEEAQFPKFIQMVLQGEDPLYEKRMEDVHRAFKTLDGTIGRKIYEKLKKE